VEAGEGCGVREQEERHSGVAYSCVATCLLNLSAGGFVAL